MEKKTRCGIYARVSTRDKDQSTENQTEPLRDIANQHHWFIHDTYEDEVSAVKYRPSLKRLLSDVKKHKVDVILVSRIDRLARSVKDLLSLIDVIVVENKIRLWFVDQGLDVDPKNAVSMLTVHVLGAMAEFERALISERVKAGMNRASKNGTILGQPRKVIDFDKLKQMRANGYSLTELQKEFKASRGTIIKRLKDLGMIVNPMQDYKEKIKEIVDQTV